MRTSVCLSHVQQQNAELLIHTMLRSSLLVVLNISCQLNSPIRKNGSFSALFNPCTIAPLDILTDCRSGDHSCWIIQALFCAKRVDIGVKFSTAEAPPTAVWRLSPHQRNVPSRCKEPLITGFDLTNLQVTTVMGDRHSFGESKPFQDYVRDYK